jgi:Histidinol phosphatase and related hydrolases of the PHP family
VVRGPLPGDCHAHSDWLWYTGVGDMDGSCARALEIGLPAIAFTEHLDHTGWRIELEGPYATETLTSIAAPDGILTPPAFDAAGYLEAVERWPGAVP